MSFVRNVFGFSPLPHSLKLPKSLYHSPSGASGSDFTHSCRRLRSAREIRRSSTRAKRCCQRPAGRSEKRIFGNCVLPEYRSDQVLSGLVLFRWILFPEERLVSGSEIIASILFGLHPPLRQAHQSSAQGEAAFTGNTADLDGQRRWNTHALPDGSCGRWSCRSGGH